MGYQEARWLCARTLLAGGELGRLEKRILYIAGLGSCASLAGKSPTFFLPKHTCSAEDFLCVLREKRNFNNMCSNIIQCN